MKSNAVPVLAIVVALIGARDSVGKELLFVKASRNYNEEGEVGKAYRREFESRVFTHSNWHQRLYFYSSDPDENQTLEIYSRPDGSRWLSYCIVKPSLTGPLWRRFFFREQFYLTEELNQLKLRRREVSLPPELAKDLERLWNTMLPARAVKSPVSTKIVIHAPIIIAFARNGQMITTGLVDMKAYQNKAYDALSQIVIDLRTIADGGPNSEKVLRQLPARVRGLTGRLR